MAIVVGLLLFLMLLLIVLLLILACKPWRFFPRSRSRTIKISDLERPLVSDDVRNQSNEFPRDYDLEGACFQNEAHFCSPQSQGLVHKQRFPALSAQLSQGDSLILDVISDPPEDVAVGQTLKLSAAQLAEIQKHRRPSFDNNRLQESVPRDVLDQRSCLTLEVISGPSRGLSVTLQSTNTSRLPLTLGRVSPSDLLIKDSEVSGKHALINWNSNKNKWEVLDMGSLNGTLLNSQPINHPDSGSRQQGDPVELVNGDIITLGTTSKINVYITSQNKQKIPFGVGMASDPMALRRGGKKLPMEDVCYYHWPLPGIDQFGLFGICDGHGGVDAARSASKFPLRTSSGPPIWTPFLPEKVASILSDSNTREKVLSLCDASDVLSDAFSQAEACMNNHQYEGCTATVLLVWTDGDEKFFAQCANVGDSACIMVVDGRQIKMSEDHKITNSSERLRIEETGEPLRDGETRLWGLNLGRMLGDKFLKQQDSRFSSEPYISEVLHINPSSNAYALLASDGLWDVVSMKKAIQLVLQTKERCSAERENLAEEIANLLLSEAKTSRTKDNTSVIFIDFDTSKRNFCKVVES